ncbi:MAG: MazG nucleotide pyrophosphohydrolase domain-containing protein [Lachnospiraceae bacterium]|nr:MazG nucleotide pyrophosphohydrolase domain-containing protein [Lachnospiraceae bacterium]
MNMKNSDERTETGKAMEQLQEIVARLRDPETGCPWDKRQTLESLKPFCIEESAEVVAGINQYTAAGNADNLKEELGDLLLQIVLQAQVAEEQGLFTLSDVIRVISEKMIRRHPHVFHPGDPDNGDLEDIIRENQPLDEEGRLLTSWADIKALEKKGKDTSDSWLNEAFGEVGELIQKAKERKGF